MWFRRRWQMSTLGIHSDDKYRRSVTISQNVNEPLDHFVMNQTSPKDSVHNSIFLPPANEVCEGYVFTPVCQSFCSQGGHAWLWEGVCVVAGGHVWLWGACMVAGGDVWVLGVCVVGGKRGHVWLQWGMHGCGGACMGYNEIRSMSGQYASYWNAFLFK